MSIRRISKLEKVVLQSPYPKNFEYLKIRSKKIRTERILKIMNWMSGNNSEAFISYFMKNTNNGKRIRKEYNNKHLEDMHKRIMYMHGDATQTAKSKVLSLVNTYSKKELKEIGYKFSNKQYKRNVTLDSDNYKNVRTSNKKIKQNIEENDLVEKEFKDHSNGSSKMDVNGKEIRFIYKPKNQIYKVFKEKNTNIKMSLSKFYYLCQKNYKEGAKKTDICSICTKGKSSKKAILISLATRKRNSIEEQKEICLQHQVVVEKQKESFRRDIKQLDRSTCRTTMDFNQNIKIGGTPVETSNMFYRKKDIYVLGLIVNYINE